MHIPTFDELVDIADDLMADWYESDKDPGPWSSPDPNGKPTKMQVKMWLNDRHKKNPEIYHKDFTAMYTDIIYHHIERLYFPPEIPF